MSIPLKLARVLERPGVRKHEDPGAKETRMRTKRNFLLIALVFFALSTVGQAQSQPPDLSKPAGTEPPMLGIHWVRGFEPNYLVKKEQKPGKPFGGGGSPDMTNHGGQVLQSPVVVPIFWGNTWSDSSDKVTGMNSWYIGFSGSKYATTTDEYLGSNGQVNPNIRYDSNSYLIDNSTAKGGNRTSSILGEVCNLVQVNGKLEPNGYYPVYVDLKRSGSYCAYHSWGSCNGTPIEFGFFWNLDGDAGCDPQDTYTGHSQGLAALGNVSGHELAETITDPTGNTWYDSSGSENGDKCVWTFNKDYVTFSNDTKWRIQGEWSNRSYDKNFGYLNNAGQDGCLDGDDFDEYLSGVP
jgi:hypothetical protein